MIFWILLIIVLLIVLIYKWMTKDFGKYESQGAFSVKPTLFFGNQYEVLLGKKSYVEDILEFYEKAKDHG